MARFPAAVALSWALAALGACSEPHAARATGAEIDKDSASADSEITSDPGAVEAPDSVVSDVPDPSSWAEPAPEVDQDSAIDTDATLDGGATTTLDSALDGASSEGGDVSEFETTADAAWADSGFPAGAGKAPPVVVLPWPPPCEKPGVYGDGGKGGYLGPNCFNPPNYCKWPGVSAASPACSPDGKYCCNFNSSCNPCYWVSCFGCPHPDCPPQCLAQPQYWEPGGEVWNTPECILFAKVVNSFDCAVCPGDTHVYCKWKSAP